MPPFLFPLPTTALLTFSNVLHDPSSGYATQLAEATAARTRLVLALKNFAESQPGSSALAVLDAVQVYLPYLQSIITCLEADELLYKGDPFFQWRSSLTYYSSSAPLLSLPSIHTEHTFVILTQILATSNYAHSILASLPAFEPPAYQASSSNHPTTSASLHISAEDEKKTTAGLARAVDLLCQAAGIADWAADNVVPALENSRSSGGVKGKWPLETGIEAFRGLSMVLLADAHVTAIRKLLLPVLPHTLFSPPGPPLPQSHPSPSLLAKLYLHVSILYSTSLAQFQIHRSTSTTANGSFNGTRKLFRDKSSTNSERSEWEEFESVEGHIIPDLGRYLRKESILSTSLSRKWLGIDSGENGKGGDNVGNALTFVKEARRGLQELEDGKIRAKMKGLGLGKGNEKRKEERKKRKGRVERELEDLQAWIDSYQRLNDTVAFQPIPPISALTIPSGRPIFSAKPFKPPPNKFGGTLPLRSTTLGEETVQGDEGATYAGKGTYY